MALTWGGSLSITPQSRVYGPQDKTIETDLCSLPYQGTEAILRMGVVWMGTAWFRAPPEQEHPVSQAV